MSEKTVEEALRKIKEAEEKLIRSNTQEESSMETLKTEYKLNSIEEVDAYIAKGEEKAEKTKKELDTKIAAFKEGFPWD